MEEKKTIFHSFALHRSTQWTFFLVLWNTCFIFIVFSRKRKIQNAKDNGIYVYIAVVVSFTLFIYS